MAARPYWKGFLRLSLVSCPVALSPATSERDKISFNQINKETGNRIRYRKVDAGTGAEVLAENITKGYAVDKDTYVEVTKDELDAVAIESKRSIDIEQFVPATEIDSLYFNTPYYVVPDGEAGEEAFAVIREAIDQKGMIAIGRVVFTSREHMIALRPRGKGMVGVTLRYPYEVRSELEAFQDIPDQKVDRDMIEMASHIIKTKSGHFHPDKFADRYEDALKAVIAKKQSGVKLKPLSDSRGPTTNVVNLMDALKKSVQSDARAPADRRIRTNVRTPPKKTTRSSARRKAG